MEVSGTGRGWELGVGTAGGGEGEVRSVFWLAFINFFFNLINQN